jgi:predicted DNA binding CopG/RHH family protein
MKLDADEKDILDSVERGEWRPARAPKRVQGRYSRYATAMFKKDRRLNSRISTKDLEAIQKRALEEASLSNSDRELVAQVRVRAARGGVVNVPCTRSDR